LRAEGAHSTPRPLAGLGGGEEKGKDGKGKGREREMRERERERKGRERKGRAGGKNPQN